MNGVCKRPAGRSAALTFGLALLVWAVFSWPLPRYADRGIPMSSQNIEQGGVRTMMPGDHLQLLYHFQLMGDFLSGRVPFFHNVYEFNTGDDAARLQEGSYFAPLSVVYAALARLFSSAGAWNLVGVLSLWGTLAATRAYVGRFTPLPAAAWIGALVSIVLPYRWVNLLGGSPSGLAMLWPPVVILALDRAVRHGRIRDGLWCGVALLFTCWSDVQVFFFVTLSLPLWVFLAAWHEGLVRRPVSWPALRARAPAGLCVLAGLAAAAAYRGIYHAHLARSEMAGGRDPLEVLTFSPSIAGFWSWRAEGLDSHIYVGVTAALIMAGLCVAAVRGRRASSASSASWVIPSCVLVALLGVMTLALGARGPFHGAALWAMRTLVPPYAMIRQTAKVFTLLPTLMALGAALAAGSLLADRRRRWPLWLAGILALACIEYKAQVRATVCLLDAQQGGYAAVAGDAGTQAPQKPHALVLPLWPGDAAETSVYQFFAQMYGIRIVNGYSPVVSRDYTEQVFLPLQAANQGELTDDALRRLERMRVRYVVLHEDLFPEKASPFPVSWTRDRLLAHPRLTLLAHEGAVWAFRIESQPQAKPAPRRIPIRFPARRIAFERLDGSSERIKDPACSSGVCRILRPGESPLTAGPWRVAPDDGLAWMIRVRGEGRLVVRSVLEGGRADEHRIPVNAPDWAWIRVPLAPLDFYGRLRVGFQAEQGTLCADTGWLINGDWNPSFAPGEVRALAAADFFHAGYSDPEDQSVTFRPERDPSDAIFYGLRLPLEPGRYTLEWILHSDAPAGTRLGECAALTDGGVDQPWTPVIAGQPTRMEWRQADNRPVRFIFRYSRAAPMRIQQLRLGRSAGPGPTPDAEAPRT